MADKFRWHNDSDIIYGPVDTAQTIEIGDLIWLNTDDLRAASQQADQSSEVANQYEFVKNFVGVALQGSDSGDTDDIAVKTRGVFEFTSAAATYEIGDLVGASEASSGTALLDQTVEAVGADNEHLAIGRVVQRYGSNTTRVLVEICSNVVCGGVQPSPYSA